MLRTVLCVSLTLLSSVFGLRAWPQASSPPTAQSIFEATVADMRGISETIDRIGPGSLGFSLPTEPSSTGIVSAQWLRHRVPKSARRAYEAAGGIQDSTKAASELENAIQIDPDFAEAHHALGVVYARQNRNPEAAAQFRRTIELVPKEAIPYSNLAWVMFAMGQRAEAETNVRRALQLSPDDATAHLLMGCLLIESPQALAEGIWHLEFAGRTLPKAKQLAEVARKK
jgi:tetratricopeptide (TPR) repeat protein